MASCGWVDASLNCVIRCLCCYLYAVRVTHGSLTDPVSSYERDLMLGFALWFLGAALAHRI